MRYLRLLPALPAALLAASAPAQGTLAFWNNSTGNWSEPARWSSNPAFPNGPDFGAVINGGIATLDGDYSVQFFGMGGGQLLGQPGRTLTNQAGFTFLTGSVGNGQAANAVTVVSNGGISLLSGAQNGTPGTQGNATVNGATLINAVGSTVAQTNGDNPLNFGSGALVRNDGLWLARTDNGMRNIGGAPSTFRNTGLFQRDQGTGTYNVGINGTVRFQNDGTMDLQTGVLALNAGGSASGPFSIAGGARLELNSDYTFQTGSSVAGGGELRLGPGARNVTDSLVFASGLLRQDAGSIEVAPGKTLEVTGPVQMLGGQLGNGQTTGSGTLRVSGGAGFEGGGYTLSNATLHVSAGATARQANTSDFVRLGTGAQLVIDGTYRAQTNNGFVNNGGGGVGIVNRGSFVRDTAAGTFNASINGPIPFTNAGSVQVQTGTLQFGNTGSSTGNFHVSAGASLIVDAPYTFDTGTTVTGAGLFVWQNGVQSIPTSLTFDVAQPRMTGGASFSIAQGSTLTLNGAFEWMGGSIGNGQAANAGTLRVNGGVTIGPGGGQNISNATLQVPAGASAFQVNASDFVRLGTNGQIRNEGTYYARTDNGVVNNGGGGVAFVNLGTMVRDTASGIFAIGINGGVLFQNAGTVQVQTGTLSLQAGGTSTGGFQIAAGAVLDFTTGYTFDAGTTATGSGRLIWSGGSQRFPTSLALNVAQPRQTGATLLIAQGQTLTLNGAFEWMGGLLGNGQPANSGTLRVNAGVTFGPNGGQTITNATLFIPSGASAYQVNASDFVRLGNGGQIRNEGTYYARTNNGLVNNGGGGIAFLNLGTFVRDTASGTFNAAISGALPFTNAGTLRVETGTLLLSGGGSSTGAMEVGAGSVLDFNADYLFDAGTTATGAGLLSFSGAAHRFPVSLALDVAQVRLTNAQLLVAQGTTLTLNSSLDWTANGSLGNGQAAQTGTLRAAGGFTIGAVGGGQSINNATLHLPAGAIGYQINASDFLRLGNGAQLRLDGTYYARTDNGIVNNGGAPSSVTNNGTFIRDTRSGVFELGLAAGPGFTNAGSVTALTGTLRISAGGSATGSFQVAESAVLEFTNGYTLDAGTTVTGAGTLRAVSGALVFPASLALGVATLAQTNGQLNIASGQTVALAGLHDWANGTLFGGGTLLAGGGASLNGAQNITNATYAVPAGASLTLQPTSGTLAIGSAGRLTNAGTLVARSNGAILHSGGGATVINTGLLQRDTGSGLFMLGGGVNFDNSGTIVAGSGILRIDAALAQYSAGMLTGGTWQVNDGGTLDGNAFAGGIVSNSAVVRLIGPGSVFAALNGLATNSGSLRLDARNFNAAGAFTNSGRIELANGSVFTVPNGSQLTNTSTGVLTGMGKFAGKLLNSGTVEARGPGTTLVLTGEVTNNGLFLAAAGGTINAIGTTFVNNGVLDNSTGTILLPADFINNGVVIGPGIVRIRSTVKTGNTVTLAIDSFTGHSYQLQRSLDLASDTFVNLGAPQTGTTGQVLTFVDPQGGGAKGFYRIVVDP